MPKTHIPFSSDLTKPSFTCTAPRPVKSQASYQIYPLSHLAELMPQVKLEVKSIRYLIDADLNLWFAQEGYPTNEIPAHYQITGESVGNARCLTAGNINFADDLKTITCINHKSGDFRPSFDSLKWALAILLSHQEQLATAGLKFEESGSIHIEELNSSGGTKENYHLNIKELTAWCAKTFLAERDDINSQPQEIVTRHYEPPAKSARPFFKQGSIKRINFGNDDEDTPDKKSHGSASLSFPPL